VEVLSQNKVLVNANDADFSLETNDGCHISLVIRPHEINAVILDDVNNCKAAFVLPLKNELSLEKSLIELIQQHKFLIETNWGSVKIGLISSQFSLIPLQIFQEDLLPNYGRILFEIKEGEEIGFYKHSKEYISVFVVSQSLKQLLEECFGESVVIAHHTSGLIEAFTSNFSVVNTSKDLLVQIENENIIILVKQQSELLFCNSFPFRTMAEIVNHVLKVMREQGMSAETGVVSLYGFVTAESEIYAMLFKYIRYIYMGERATFVSFSSSFDHYSGYRHFDAFGLHLCK
jgi:hypothetical protein